MNAPAASPAGETRNTQQGYNRAAYLYERLGGIGERLWARGWRRRQWEHVNGRSILEVAIGTGHNFFLYPSEQSILALDLSAGMLSRAQAKAREQSCSVDLLLADAQDMPFPNGAFDCIVSSFTLCSIDEPRRALAEAHRVLRPGGRIVALEHGLSRLPVLHWAFKTFSFIGVWLYGDNMGQENHKLIAPPDWTVLHAEYLLLDIVKLVVAEKASVPKPA